MNRRIQRKLNIEFLLMFQFEGPNQEFYAKNFDWRCSIQAQYNFVLCKII